MREGIRFLLCDIVDKGSILSVLCPAVVASGWSIFQVVHFTVVVLRRSCLGGSHFGLALGFLAHGRLLVVRAGSRLSGRVMS